MSGPAVRLVGAGVDVSAAHDGVRPGLRNALHDVRRERSRRGGGTPLVRDVVPDQEARPGLVSLRRAGELLTESFLPAPVAQADADSYANLSAMIDEVTARP
ncbi:hypothetical protein [Dactylosporangium sp. CA-139066]|uniref:hypothetical protein n=1 Tax=Dactylosporangium sp. CA-139066 TaxID=3239930 RepID=UPI003D8C642C